ALHWRNDGGTFRALPPRGVACFDIDQVKTATENRFHVSEVAGGFARSLHVILDTRITQKIALHVLLRGGALDAELRSQAKRRHAVNHAEVDHLRAAALFAVNG